MKKLLLSTFTILALLLTSCSKKCYMSNSDKWQTLIKGADITKQVNAITELVASLDADINQLSNTIGNAKGDAKLKLSWDLNKTVKKSKYKETIWDKDVWHEIQLASRVYCALQSEIQAGMYKTDAQYASALVQLKQAKEYLLVAKKKAEESTTM
jgi:hypothetical protein